jgi:hypothetical protein
MNETAPFHYRDLPILLWLFGVGFLVALAYLLFRYGLKGNVGLAIFFAIFGISLLAFSSIVDISTDPIARKLIISKRSLLKRSREEIPFEDILEVRVDSQYNSDNGGATYRVEILHKDGKVSPLHAYYSSGYSDKQNLADAIREAVGLAPPPEPGTPSSVKEGETDGVHWKIETFSSPSQTMTRWSSSDFVSDVEHFLLLSQRVPSASKFQPKGKLGKKVNTWAISLLKKFFHFDELDFPNLKKVTAYPLPPRLEAQFFALTDDPAYAQRLLIPWVTTPLAEWSERNPIPDKSAEQTHILFSPLALYIVTLRDMDIVFEEGIISLGVELIRALQG